MTLFQLWKQKKKCFLITWPQLQLIEPKLCAKKTLQDTSLKARVLKYFNLKNFDNSWKISIPKYFQCLKINKTNKYWTGLTLLVDL